MRIDSIKFAQEFVKRLLSENEKNFIKIAGDLSRILRRIVSMILSDGLINTILFAYNKAKVQNLKRICKNGRIFGVSEKEIKKETYKWVLATYFLTSSMVEREGKITQKEIPHLDSILEKLVSLKQDPSRYYLLQEMVIMDLEALSKITGAYGEMVP